MPAKDFLTVKERLLFHLHYFKPDTSEYSVFPKELTRSGIARAIFIDEKHVSRSMKPFIEKDMAREEWRSTLGGKRKQKVYYLTEPGHSEAEKVVEKCLGISLVLRRKNGKEQQCSLSEVGTLTSLDIPLLQVLEVADKDRSLDEIDLVEALSREGEKFASHTETMHRPRYFFGRKKELADFESILTDTPVLVLTGIAGIGKTTLTAKFMENMADRYNRFWFDFREWTTLHGLQDRLSRFLADLGHDDLKIELQKSENPPMEIMESILSRSLRDSNSMLVFDDFQFASPSIVDLFKVLVLQAGITRGVRIIISCRMLPDVPFYDRRDATVRNIVKEYPLKGLDMEDCREMLSHRGIEVNEEDLITLWSRLGGHPFFFEVINSTSDISSIIQEEGDISMFLDNEIYSHLSKGEQELLGFISVFREPVPAHLLRNSFGSSEEILARLMKRSLVVAETGDSYDTHSILKDFFYGKLPAAQLLRFHGIASDYYRGAGEDRHLTELPFHLLRARRFEDALKIISSSVDELINLGKAEELDEILIGLEKEEMGDSWSMVGLLRTTVEIARGNHDQAQTILTELLSRKDEIRPKIIASAYKNMGYLGKIRADWKSALFNYEKAMSISLSIKDDRGLAEAYEGMGSVAFRQGDHERAIKFNTRCMDAAGKLGDLDLQTASSIDLGLSCYYSGKIEDAIDHFLKSLDLLDVKVNNYQKARVLNNLGACYFMKDRHDNALEMWERCLQISTVSGFANFEAAACVNAADIYSRKENWDRARDYLARGEKKYREQDHKVGIGYATLTWARFYKRKKDWNDSEKYFARAIKMARKNKTLDNLAENYLEMGFMYREKGDKQKALGSFKDALKIYQEQNNDTLITKVEREIESL